MSIEIDEKEEKNHTQNLIREEEGREEEKRVNIIDVQLKALDDVVAVNSLFTIAIFIGLSLASPNQRSLEGHPECDADPGTAQRLVLYEVVSFGFFFLSSLSAKTCKVILNTRKYIYKDFGLFHYSRGILILVAGISSVAGVSLLTLSMVNVVQIKIGRLSCGSTYAIQSVVYLCSIVLLALVIYGSHMIYAVIYYIVVEKWLDRESWLRNMLEKLIIGYDGENEPEEQKKNQQEEPKKTDGDANVLNP